MPQSIDNMTALINTIDRTQLAHAWSLGGKAVRSRLNGERDLTIREICEVSKLLGARTSDLLG